MSQHRKGVERIAPKVRKVAILPVLDHGHGHPFRHAAITVIAARVDG
jgi:hypothetical protein